MENNEEALDKIMSVYKIINISNLIVTVIFCPIGWYFTIFMNGDLSKQLYSEVGKYVLLPFMIFTLLTMLNSNFLNEFIYRVSEIKIKDVFSKDDIKDYINKRYVLFIYTKYISITSLLIFLLFAKPDVSINIRPIILMFFVIFVFGMIKEANLLNDDKTYNDYINHAIKKQTKYKVLP